MRKVQILLLTVVLAASCFSMTGCMVSFGGFGNLNAKFIEEKDWTLEAAGVNLIDGDTTNGSIKLTASDTNEVKVHAVKTVRAKTDEAAEDYAKQVTLVTEKSGDSIRFYKEQPSGWKKVQVSVSYTIECPRDLSVHLRSTNGKITVEGIEKKVDAKTTNGAIDLAGGSDSIMLRTTNGSISVHDSRGSIDASTTNGKISANIKDLGNKVNLSSTNGGINLEVESGNAPIEMTTTNGSATITLPANYSGELDAGTHNGRVSSDFAIPVKKASKTSLRGPIGDGGDKVFIRTTNGSIKVNKR